MDLIESLSAEEGIIPDWRLGEFGSMVAWRAHNISNAAVVSVLDIDAFLLLGEVCCLSEPETGEMDILHHLEICIQDLLENQNAEIASQPNESLSTGVPQRVEL